MHSPCGLLFLGLALGSIVYALLRMLYNITIHPLAKFPGPRLAASTRLYELYYELWLGGQFGDRIYQLHQQYGPIIRVNPFEVHILDHSFYDELFNFNSELDMRKHTFDNLLESPSFELHKKRRRAFDPYFSRASILRLEPVIGSLVEKMCTQIRKAKGRGTPVNMSTVYRCLTMDVISEYCFSRPYGALDDAEKNERFMTTFAGVFKILLPMREYRWFQWVTKSMSLLPQRLTDESMAWMQGWQGGLMERLRDIKAGKKELMQGRLSHPTVFEQYIYNDTVPLEEKSDKILFDNALLFVSAGLESTGFALSTATYHVLANPSILRALKAELSDAWRITSGTPSVAALEKPPLLTACLKESLRLSVGVMSRFHRLNRRKSIMWRGWSVPPGYAVSMSQRFILYNEEIFPDPKAFRPERWLQGEKSKALDKWLVVFSRGARGCIGQHLAWTEMYLALASIVHGFDMTLHDTDRRHVDPKYDYFVPFPESERGVRVMVE